jgi:hypothetical protein
VALSAAVIGAVATITGATIDASLTPAGPGVATFTAPASSPAPSASPVFMAGDDATFISDVTYPDGSKVTVGSTFVKKWELKNTGSVRWVNRYLAAIGPSQGACTFPARVPVPATNPGQTVIISVPVTAPSTPQLCYVPWKMVTANNVLYFPSFIGVWFEVKVVGGTN